MAHPSQPPAKHIPEGWDDCVVDTPGDGDRFDIKATPPDWSDDEWPDYVVPMPLASSPSKSPEAPVVGNPHPAPKESPALTAPKANLLLIAGRPFPKVGSPLKLPAMATRSALFQVGGFAGAPLAGPLASSTQYELSYFGPRLSMRDKRIWEIAMAAAQKHGWLNSEFPLALSMVAKGLGVKDRSTKTSNSIFESLRRLSEAKLSFTIKGTSFGSGHLLGSARKEKSRAFISVDSAFTEIAFTKDVRFAIPHLAREKVSTDLGLWLCDFAWVNEEYEKGFDVQYLWRMSGSGTTMDGFMKHLRTALDEVSSSAPGVLPSYRIEKIGRGARAWKVFMKRGGDIAAFELPRSERSKGAGAAMGSKGQKQVRKGGVAL